jgi:hypothetical protein
VSCVSECPSVEPAHGRAYRRVSRRARKGPAERRESRTAPWGWIAAETGHPEEGVACIERALGLQEALGLKGQLPTSHLRLAEAHFAASHYELAAVAARRARDLAESLGDTGRRARAFRVLADAGVETADDGAEALYRELQRVASDHDLRPLQAHAHLGLARLSHRAGPPGQAGDHPTTAMAMYRDMGMTHWSIGRKGCLVETRQCPDPSRLRPGC